MAVLEPKNYQIQQKVGADSWQPLHPETNGDIVNVTFTRNGVDESTKLNTALSGLVSDIGEKQDALTFDTTPTAQSTNPVTSSGIKTYADTKKTEAVAAAKSYTDDQIKAVTGGAGVVTSVNGKQGAVTLAKGDIGLGNVDNTSDANKPISTATQAALNAKAGRGEQVFFYKGTLTGGGITECSTGLLHPTPTASTVEEINHYNGTMVLDEIGQCFYVTAASGDPASGSFMFTLQHDSEALKKDTAPTQYSQAFISSGGVYAAIENAKTAAGTAANSYADTKKAEAISSANSYTDQQITAIMGGDVADAYNSFKELQDLLEGELGSATDGLIGQVNANTQGVTEAKALANGAQSTADTNATAITNIVNGTTKVKKAEVADSATTANTATTAGKLSGNQTITLTGDVSGTATWTNSTGSQTVTATLAGSGVSAGSYSAVTVDEKGRVTDGGHFIVVEGAGLSVNDLYVGGLYFKKV